MKTYGIEVPFPEVMTQQEYDELYYQKTFFEIFNVKEYGRCCDILDKAIKELLNVKKEVFIEDKDVYTPLHINYAETRKELLKARGIDLECVRDEINKGFKIKLVRGE